MRAFTLATTLPWAIEPEALRTLLAIAAREQSDREAAALIRELRAQRPTAVAAQRGRPLDNTSGVMMRDRVALLPVEGVIVRRADLFTEISGGASVETLARDFTTALGDPNVGAILLCIDSPGGEVTGIHDFAEMVYAARDQKPIHAYVEGIGASAAYWIASATSQITIEATADLGSIGVVMAVPDPAAKKATDITFISSQSPNKRSDPNTESGRSRYQQIVDDTADVFIEAVARNRGMSTEQVVRDFDAGGIMTGRRAVAARLADRIGTLEATIAELNTLPPPTPPARSPRAERPIDRYSLALRSKYRETI